MRTQLMLSSLLANSFFTVAVAFYPTLRLTKRAKCNTDTMDNTLIVHWCAAVVRSTGLGRREYLRGTTRLVNAACRPLAAALAAAWTAYGGSVATVDIRAKHEVDRTDPDSFFVLKVRVRGPDPARVAEWLDRHVTTRTLVPYGDEGSPAWIDLECCHGSVVVVASNHAAVLSQEIHWEGP